MVKLMESSVDCVIRLGKISLRPEVLSPPEYIDLLIDGEKSEAKSGWKKRVQYLINIRGKAEEDDDDEEENSLILLIKMWIMSYFHCTQTPSSSDEEDDDDVLFLIKKMMIKALIMTSDGDYDT